MERIRAGSNWLALISGALAASVEVFLHRTRSFGSRYLDLRAAAVVLMIPFYSLMWEGYDLVPLMQFLAGYLFMCLLVRLSCVMNSRRGHLQEHSRYTGYPRIKRLLRSTSETTIKLAVEPLLVFTVGIFAMPWNEPLGGYLILAAAGLLISTHLNAGYSRVRSLDMHDAYIEQRQLAELFRQLRGDSHLN